MKMLTRQIEREISEMLERIIYGADEFNEQEDRKVNN